MSAIDVGPPTFTNRTLVTTINGTNFSTAMRIYMWDDNYGGIADEDWAIYFDNPTGIHNQSAVLLGGPPSAGQQQTNLHLLNPIGYNNKIVTQVLLDYLTEQLHVGHGVIRMRPTGDGATSQWTAFGTKWAQIDEPMSDPDLTDGMIEATAGQQQDLTFPSLPSNALWALEAIVAFFGSMTKGPSGSDEGLGFGFQLKHAVVGDLSRKLIGDMYANGSINAQRVKLDRINQLPTVFNASFLAVTAERGSAGASPNPAWTVYTLEMLVYYSINEPWYDVIDPATFAALDARFTAHPQINPPTGGPWYLDFDLIDTTGYEGLLDIMAHAPELFMYINASGLLCLGSIGAYAGTPSPRQLSTVDGSIREVRKGPYRVDERYANAVELRWGVTITATGSANATEDPTNPPNDRGNRKYTRGARGIPVAGWEDTKVLDRHFIRRDTNKNVAEACARMYLHLWGEEDGEEVSGMELLCPYRCVDVEPGDVVHITVPNLGLSQKHYLCVEKSFLATDELLLTVYDVENTL